MINRKVLYGYQIQNGTLEIVPITPGLPIRPSRTP